MWFKHGRPFLADPRCVLPAQPGLKSQLCAPGYSEGGDKKIRVESKQDVIVLNNVDPTALEQFINYSYNGTNNRFGERWYYRFSTDLSGLEEFGLNRLWSAIFGKQT